MRKRDEFIETRTAHPVRPDRTGYVRSAGTGSSLASDRCCHPVFGCTPGPYGQAPGALARVFSVRQSVVLTEIDAVGTADAWVGGEIERNDGTSVRALVGHWNGRTWSRAAVPHVLAARFRGQELDAFGASSNRDVWVFSATGSYLRLTGNRWQFGRLPQRIKTRHYIIAAAEVLSPTNVWVFGTHYIGSIDRLKFVPFAARFDGRTWRAVRIRVADPFCAGSGGATPASPPRSSSPTRSGPPRTRLAAWRTRPRRYRSANEGTVPPARRSRSSRSRGRAPGTGPLQHRTVRSCPRRG